MKIKVEKVKQNEKNPNVFGIASEGTWYSMFCQGGVCPLKEGQEYEVDYKPVEKEGTKFHNIYYKPTEATELPPTPTPVEELETKVGPSPYDKKTDRIEKMACLKAACFFSNDAETCIKNAQILLRSLDKKWLNDSAN